MANFSIIALRVLPNNPENIRKVLPKEGAWYLFNQSYKIENKGSKEKEELVKNEDYPLNDDFFGKNINITAIVGKNGSGKSSLLDLMFRIINNFAFWLVKNQQRNAAEQFYYIRDVYADLHFVSDGKRGILHCRGNFVGFTYDKYKIGFNFLNEETPSEFQTYKIYGGRKLDKEPIEIAQSFFYTIVTNYSMQAFLDSDYSDEQCGHFDVKNGNPKYDSSRIWINSMFHKNDGYSAPIVLNPYRDEGTIDLANEFQLTKQRLAAILIESQKKGKRFIEDYQLNKIEYAYAPTSILQKFKSYKSIRDLRIDFKNALNKGDEYYPTYISVILNQFNDTFSENLGEKQIDAYIYLVYKTLNVAAKYPSYNRYSNLSEFIREYTEKEKQQISENANRARQCGEESGNHYASIEIQHWENKLKPLFKRTIDDIETAELLKNLVEDIKKDNSHITLKIKQTLNFLKKCNIQKLSTIQNEGFDFKYEDYIKNLHPKEKLNGLYKIMEFLPPPFFSYEIKLDKTRKDKEIEMNIPFQTLSSGEKQFLYSVSTLIYHIKNLRSIKSTPSRPRITYRKINLVLDEVELCFHPEYQRLFIDNLVKIITRLRLNCNGCHFNIIFATHSPFLLSDIPNCNIMYLEEGEQIESDKMSQTFASNIHDILRDSFFLENGFIGEFAQKKIKPIIEEINKLICHNGKEAKEKNKKTLDQKKYEEYIKIIELIGEPLIKNKLMMMLSEVYDNVDDRIEMLKQEIKNLENLKKQ